MPRGGVIIFNPFGVTGYRRWVPVLWMLPAMVLFAAFTLYPSIFTAYYSMTSYSGTPGTTATFIGLQNYKTAFSLGGWFSLRPELETTILFAVVITLVQNLGGLCLALVFNRKVRGVSFYRLAIFSPQVLSVVVIGMIWSMIFSPAGGPAAALWTTVFHHSSSFFGSYILARWLVIFVQSWSGVGFTMLIYLAGLQTIPVELYEAAKIDGAGAWRMFSTVTWPLLAASATVNIFLSVIGGLHEFAMVYVLTDGNAQTMTLGMAMFNETFAGADNFGYGATLQMVQFAMVLIIGSVMLWYLRRREVQL